MITFLIVYTAVSVVGCAVSKELVCIPGIF